MPRKGAQAKAFAAQQAKKREQEKQEARAKVDNEKNNAKGISECRDVGQLMRMHRANSERIEHMEEEQGKEAKRKEAERAAKEKELEESQGKSWWDRFLPKPKGPREATSPNKVQQQRDNIEQFYDLLKCSKHVKREIQAVFKAFDANKDGRISASIDATRVHLTMPGVVSFSILTRRFPQHQRVPDLLERTERTDALPEPHLPVDGRRRH